MNPPDNERRAAIKALISKVRRILLEEWDPICVGANPHLADEYDDVLGQVIAGLAEPPPLEDITTMLFELALGYGIPHPVRDASATAALSLLKLRLANDPWPNGVTHDLI